MRFLVSSTSTTVRVRPIFYPKYRRTFAPEFRTNMVWVPGLFRIWELVPLPGYGIWRMVAAPT